jgi:hypothetical protein
MTCSKSTLPILAAIGGLIIGLAIPNACLADVKGCLPGVHTHVFARRAFVISDDEASRFHADLERHSSEIGLSYGSVGGSDPATSNKSAEQSMTSILQSHSVGTVIEISTSSRSRFAKIYVGNNCFEPREDWRPYWTKFNSLIKRLGYGRSHGPRALGQ